VVSTFFEPFLFLLPTFSPDSGFFLSATMGLDSQRSSAFRVLPGDEPLILSGQHLIRRSVP